MDNTFNTRGTVSMREVVRILKTYALVSVLVALIWDELQRVLARFPPPS
jgi:muconolactone delta-isomerase